MKLLTVQDRSEERAVILSKTEKIRIDYHLRSLHRKRDRKTVEISFDDINTEISLS